LKIARPAPKTHPTGPGRPAPKAHEDAPKRNPGEKLEDYRQRVQNWMDTAKKGGETAQQLAQHYLEARKAIQQAGGNLNDIPPPPGVKIDQNGDPAPDSSDANTAPPAPVEMTPEQERESQEKYKMGSDILTPYDCPIGDGKVDVLQTLIGYVKVLKSHESDLIAHGVNPLPGEGTPENLQRWWDSGKDINIAAIRQDGWTLLDAHGDYQNVQHDLAENMGGFHEVWNDDPAMKARDKFNKDQQRTEANLQDLRTQGDVVRQVADHIQQALFAKRDQMGKQLSGLVGTVGNNVPDFEKRVQSALAIWGWKCPTAVGKDEKNQDQPFSPSHTGVDLQDILGYCRARYTSQSASIFRDKWYVTQNFWEELSGKDSSDQSALAVLASVKPDELGEMGVPKYVQHGEGNQIYADNTFVTNDLKKMRDAIEISCKTLLGLHNNMKDEISGYYDTLQDALNGSDQTHDSSGGGSSGGGGAGGGSGSGGGSDSGMPPDSSPIGSELSSVGSGGTGRRGFGARLGRASARLGRANTRAIRQRTRVCARRSPARTHGQPRTDHPNRDPSRPTGPTSRAGSTGRAG
jgi:hypothetical protein